MATAQITFDPKEILGKIDELEKTLLPRAANNALHKAVFETSKELSKRAGQDFAHTVPFTLKSFLYRKPKSIGEQIEASVFIRDDAPKGNAPADYLSPPMTGSLAYRTRFQRRLERKGILGGEMDKYMMPALQSTNRSHLKKGEYTRALWGIRAMEDIRVQGSMNTKRGYKTSGKYIWVPPNLSGLVGAESHASLVRSLNKGKLPKAGIYKVLKSGLRQKFISLDYIPKTPKGKFDFLAIAEDTVGDIFEAELIKNLKR
tara:strand:- start:140 stop:916 length:777 start_codon:yes stop_codon:yes gene_type:complete